MEKINPFDICMMTFPVSVMVCGLCSLAWVITGCLDMPAVFMTSFIVMFVSRVGIVVGMP